MPAAAAAAASSARLLPHWPDLLARHLQFFHVGKLPVMDSAEAYQPDTRLRLGMGVKAAGVGGKAPTAGALEPEPVLVCSVALLLLLLPLLLLLRASE